jgi:probable dihydroxyacetone kinase regulator
MKDPRNSRTCKAIVKAFKELLEEKDYEKISISDITRKAEINRKTFYYHFTDIHDLVVWTFDNEAVEHMRKFNMVSDYKAAIEFIMDYLEKNEIFVSKIARGVAVGELRTFLYKDLYETVLIVAKNINSMRKEPFEDDYIHFISEFYTEAIAGALMHWAIDPTIRDRQKMTIYLETIMGETVRQLLG